MRILDLDPHDESLHSQVGDLLRSVKAARDPMPVVRESLTPVHFCRVAMLEDGRTPSPSPVPSYGRGEPEVEADSESDSEPLSELEAESESEPLSGASLRAEERGRGEHSSAQVAGWLWGRPLFDGDSWELKWLIVDPSLQRSGIGSALVRDFETWCAARGVLTIWLMTGEELGRTNLFGTDLFDQPLAKLQSLELLADHPIRFYKSLGYQLIGVIPDANGVGCPEYLMARSLR